MNIQINERIKNLFNKKNLLIIYFVFFIILNVADFLNLLSSDFDFFKKILSWIIIGYLFYIVSFTQIFIGKRIIIYDLLYLIGFSFVTIPRLLYHYVTTTQNNFYIFSKIINLISNIDNYSSFLYITTIIGIIIIISNSIIIIRNNQIYDNSLIGSFKLSEYQKFIKLQYILLISVSLFISFTIFNLFMEWFALAVDSIILVFGLIYYLFKYIHNHTKINTNYLKDVSNSGNIFFQNLIKNFSNKKTLFIGISFLLTLHLLVDVGVFLVPYSIGTQNTLYFNSLSIDDREHKPIFSLVNLNQESQSLIDIIHIPKDFFISTLIIFIHLISLIFFIIIMVMPFYIFYKNINKEKIKISKFISIIILTFIVFFITNNLFMTNLQNPINIGIPKLEQINGVDIFTKPITEKMNNEIDPDKVKDIIEKIRIEIITITIITLTTILFLIFRYEKYQLFFEKISLILILAFFIIYISIFFYTSTKNEINNIKSEIFESNQNKISNNDIKTQEFLEIINKYEKDEIDKYGRKIGIPEKNNKTINEILEINAISYQDKDYFLIKFESKKNKKIILLNKTNILFDLNEYNNILKSKNDESFYILYDLGKETIFQNNKFSYNNIKQKVNSLFNNNFYLIKNTNILDDFKKLNQNIIEIVRLISMIIFYLIGTISFVIYFIKENIFNFENKINNFE